MVARPYDIGKYVSGATKAGPSLHHDLPRVSHSVCSLALVKLNDPRHIQGLIPKMVSCMAGRWWHGLWSW